MFDALRSLLADIRTQADRPDARLAATVLEKRALSSAHSLAASVSRWQAEAPLERGDNSVQLALSLFADSDETDDRDRAPGLAARLLADDGRWLRDAVLSAATKAVHGERKLAALRRLLRRLLARGERAIVFTEYRDTLMHVRESVCPDAMLVHGGMSLDERSTAIARFTHGSAPILLATDAASEGLNLHTTCRVIINLELPWNPMRLEQRIGRVDRIGQTRRVHVFHLIARDSAEVGLLARLHERLQEAGARIAVCDPLGLPQDVTPDIEGTRFADEGRVEHGRLIAIRAWGSRRCESQEDTNHGDVSVAIARGRLRRA